MNVESTSITLSDEQADIVKQCENYNVVVDSVAGSGKTTVILETVRKYNKQIVLILTYNSRLKAETREKIKKYNLKNVECHSYHSFCVKYYNHKCFTDDKIKNLIEENSKALKLFNFERIILDEAQDITELYFKLISKIYFDNNNVNIKWLIVGDEKQSIYQFKGADQRFIIFAQKIFNYNDTNSWKICKLSTSFRITKEMADFINNVALSKKRIHSDKISGIKPRYIICDIFNRKRTFDIIAHHFKKGYKSRDIFVLAPSVKGNRSAIKKFEKECVKHNIKVHLSCADEEKLDNDIIKNKLVISTFQSTKGLERPVVILFGWDSSYFEFIDKNSCPNICPNVLYVAMTRGIEELTFIHHQQNDYLPFMKKEKIKEYCYFIDYTPSFKSFNMQMRNKKNLIKGVTQLTRYLDDNQLSECLKPLSIVQLNKPNKVLDIKNKIKIIDAEDELERYESVGEITGIAIPAIYELKDKNKMSIYTTFSEKKTLYTKEFIKQLKQYGLDKVFKDLMKKTPNKMSISEVLKLTTYWYCYQNDLLHKVKQINKYNWLPKEIVQLCLVRLENVLKCNDSSAKFEHEISTSMMYELFSNAEELYNYQIRGFMDIYSFKKNIIFELKCKQALSQEDILQVAIYKYIMEMIYDNVINEGKLKKYFTEEKREILKNNGHPTAILYNIFTEEKLEIKASLESLKKMMNTIIYEKYIKKKDKVNDEEFLKQTIEIKDQAKEKFMQSLDEIIV